MPATNVDRRWPMAVQACNEGPGDAGALVVGSAEFER